MLRTPKMNREVAAELWNEMVAAALTTNDPSREELQDKAFKAIVDALAPLNQGEQITLLECFRLELIASAEEFKELRERKKKVH